MKNWRTHIVYLTFLLLIIVPDATAQKVRTVNIAKGWAGNSINTVVFRKNSLASFKDYQFTGFYDSLGFMMIGKRKLGSQSWELKQTPFKGNIRDAHNSISMIVDGEGFLHIAWDHHNSKLRYVKSKEPLSLELTEEMTMISSAENKVSYPEFYTLPDGGLLFFYRDGGSGNGNMVINRYDLSQKKWNRIQSNLIDGEGKRNAYWQSYVDAKGVIYLSWVWRESPDVASNHDMCFAKSMDGGQSWQKSTGEKYSLPINATNAEYACRIPQKSELINQTSMHADGSGNIVIATYWRDANSNIPQYHLVYNKGQEWKVMTLDFRKTPFSLSGTGSKKIPVARPQVLIRKKGKNTSAWLFFRDEERGSKVSVASIENISQQKFTVKDLFEGDTGAWEPSFDTDLWKKKNIVHLFVQRTVQADGEGLTSTPPQMVQVLEWKP
ncbi:MAG: BNR repeat-containing protein [Chitinophagaceae bacterium]